MTAATTTPPTLAAVIDELVGLLAPDQGEMLTDEGRRLFGLACRAQSLVRLSQGDLREAVVSGDYGCASVPAVDGAPVRIQLRRTKGWKMPANTVSAARPGKWGNPFTMAKAIDAGYATEETAQAFVVECFRDWNSPVTADRWWMGPESDARRRPFVEDIGQLRGKNLACWCRPGSPCHADVLLELANTPSAPPLDTKACKAEVSKNQHKGERL